MRHTATKHYCRLEILQLYKQYIANTDFAFISRWHFYACQWRAAAMLSDDVEARYRLPPAAASHSLICWWLIDDDAYYLEYCDIYLSQALTTPSLDSVEMTFHFGISILLFIW